MDMESRYEGCTTKPGFFFLNLVKSKDFVAICVVFLTKYYCTPIDSVPPVIQFTDAPSVTNKYPRFTWESSEFATFKCSFDGEDYEDCGEGEFGTWTKSNVGDGKHVLYVTATDLANNLGASISHMWTVGKTFSAIVFVYA